MFETVSRTTCTAVVPSLIASSLFALMCMSLLSNPLDAAPGSKTEILPVQKAAPAAVAIETAGSEAELRRQMRAKNGVAELHTGTVRFSQAPTGAMASSLRSSWAWLW